MSSQHQWQVHPWHQALIEGLVEARREQRLSHALLLSGPTDIGKSHLADCFAAYLLCQDKEGSQSFACGACKSCALLAAGTHPDMTELAPESAGKAILVDSVRALHDFVSTKSQQGGIKVVKIESANALNENAANALLKMLEEPPGDICFLLVTDSEGQMLPTIRSRCYPLKLPMPARAVVSDWLRQTYPDHQSDVDSLLQRARGLPLMAARLLEESGADGECLQQLAGLKQGRVSVSDCAEALSVGDTAAVLDQLIQFVSAQGLMPVNSRSADAAACLGDASAEDCVTLLEELMQAKRLVTGQTNPNPQLLLESLLISWKNRLY